MPRQLKAVEVFAGSDGDLTKRYYEDLQLRGQIGIVAMNLFRAQKCSSRAKVYRGGVRGKGSYRSMAYDRKQWSMNNLCGVLGEHAAALGIGYGWKQDPNTKFQDGDSWVLYVDLPQGQVSFHSPTRGAGPDYSGEFDRQYQSVERILQFCDSVMEASNAVARV